jgi:hypothetical protein
MHLEKSIPDSEKYKLRRKKLKNSKRIERVGK